MQITMLGSGAWGTALANLLCENGHQVTLWSRSAEKAAAMEIESKLKGRSVTIKAKAGQGGKLFGSVTSSVICDAIKKSYGVELDKKKVVLKNDIKTYGDFGIDIKLSQGISASMTVKVEPEE